MTDMAKQPTYPRIRSSSCARNWKRWSSSCALASRVGGCRISISTKPVVLILMVLTSPTSSIGTGPPPQPNHTLHCAPRRLSRDDAERKRGYIATLQLHCPPACSIRAATAESINGLQMSAAFFRWGSLPEPRAAGGPGRAPGRAEPRHCQGRAPGNRPGRTLLERSLCASPTRCAKASPAKTCN